MKRKRAHVPCEQKLAAALAMLLPQEARDDLRSRKAPAKKVIRLFTADHIALHAFGGSDKWYNLDMRLRDETLKAKDAADTSRVAKTRRIDGKWSQFTRDVLGVTKRKKPPSRWPKRRLGV